MTIVEFLRARLDDDEAEAKAASPGPWHVGEDRDEVLAVDEIKVADGFALSNRQLRATTAHIARHDPARVLREVEVKRALVATCERFLDDSNMGELAFALLKALASVYDDHPDYDTAWAVALDN